MPDLNHSAMATLLASIYQSFSTRLARYVSLSLHDNDQDGGDAALLTTNERAHPLLGCLFTKAGGTRKVILLHLAAFYGNYSAVDVLLEHYSQRDLSVVRRCSLVVISLVGCSSTEPRPDSPGVDVTHLAETLPRSEAGPDAETHQFAAAIHSSEREVWQEPLSRRRAA